MRPNRRVKVAAQQCQRIALLLREQGLVPKTYATLERASPDLPPDRLTDYYFFLSMLLFDFKGMEAQIGSRVLHGADLFFALARRRAEVEPDFFTSSRLAEITTEGLAAVFSLDGSPGNTLLPRCQERAEILRDGAARLLSGYRGSARELLDASEGYLHRRHGMGLLGALADFRGYRDPHFKKAFVLLKFLSAQGHYAIKDKENLYIPVDYHLLRVALRSGMVDVCESGLKRKLKERQEASPGEEDEVREAVKLAYKEVEKASDLDVFRLDEIFWTLGRSCCHYSRPPRCSQCDRSGCSVMESFHVTCPGRCLISPVCRGARDGSYQAFFEPAITTIFY
ncbi:MAG: hypothetical protein HY783_09155 [Chloroflexi bacterium]|nr:hypothetical protein [Chloroflexota bacterium]